MTKPTLPDRKPWTADEWSPPAYSNAVLVDCRLAIDHRLVAYVIGQVEPNRPVRHLRQTVRMNSCPGVAGATIEQDGSSCNPTQGLVHGLVVHRTEVK